MLRIFFIYIYICYGDISYHTAKMYTSNPDIFSDFSSLGETTSYSLRDIWLTNYKPSTASTSFVWLPFFANTITFTYHSLFELFFHRSYLKTTTTYIYIYIYIYIINSCWLLGVPELSLTIHPYRPLFLAFGCILYPHRDNICKSLLVSQFWHFHL